jgi:hypothetical protein
VLPLTLLCLAFPRGSQTLRRVAVFSLSRLSRQGIFETFFSPLLLRCSFFPAFLRASELLSGSRYLVFVVFAVKDFVNFLLRPPASNFSLSAHKPVGGFCCASVGSEAGGGVCSRSGSLGKYFCHYLSFSKKPRSFHEFRSKKPCLLCSDRVAGGGFMSSDRAAGGRFLSSVSTAGSRSRSAHRREIEG